MEYRLFSVPFFVFFVAFLLFPLTAVCSDMSYNIPEETKRQYVIGNIAKDLRMDVKQLSARKARIDSEDSSKRYCDINLNTGDLIVAETIDREELCGSQIPCILSYDLVLENPLEVHRIILQIQDINDNAPRFPNERIIFEIRESADKGQRFRLDEAHDADVGQNAVNSYSLQKNQHFILTVHDTADGGKYAELVLEKELDREQQKEIDMILTATDGGSPQRSGTAVIHITVLDANDNVPVFSESVYKVTLAENTPSGTEIIRVSATDADEGQNGEVIYEFSRMSDKTAKLFSIDKTTGQIVMTGEIDYEKDKKYEMGIQAKDASGLASAAKVIIDITDVTSYLIIALVCVSTFFLTFIILIVAVKFCHRRKPRLLFDGAVAVPSAYLPPNYAEVDRAETLRSSYNYDAYLTTGSRTSDFKFVSSYNENTLPAGETLKKEHNFRFGSSMITLDFTGNEDEMLSGNE
ncbi:protocadherin gamma-B7-like [Sinocyclocheilus anshuiensis]|uniref:protocadherin gamma-B7-like n=1 Tax=Sinocyclocheilus anshuiensis TaxID=1608454 RepID=UPI0007B7A616|nr:PREDICTED: protocadherin gamma-B7-like [Sinocyclocheilus anshuiensis]